MTIPSGLGLRKVRQASGPRTSSPPPALKARLKGGESSAAAAGAAGEREPSSSTPQGQGSNGEAGPSGTQASSSASPPRLQDSQRHRSLPHHRRSPGWPTLSIKDRLAAISRERRIQEHHRQLFGNCTATTLFVHPAGFLAFRRHLEAAESTASSNDERPDDAPSPQPLHDDHSDLMTVLSSAEKSSRSLLEASAMGAIQFAGQMATDEAAGSTSSPSEAPSKEAVAATQPSVSVDGNDEAHPAIDDLPAAPPQNPSGARKKKKNKKKPSKAQKRARAAAAAEAAQAGVSDVQEAPMANGESSEVKVDSKHIDAHRPSTRGDGAAPSPFLAPPALTCNGAPASPLLAEQHLRPSRRGSGSGGQHHRHALTRKMSKDSAGSNVQKPPSRASSRMTMRSDASSEAVELEATPFHNSGWPERQSTLRRPAINGVVVHPQSHLQPPSRATSPRTMEPSTAPQLVYPYAQLEDVSGTDAAAVKSLDAGPSRHLHAAQSSAANLLPYQPNGINLGASLPPRGPRMQMHSNGASSSSFNGGPGQYGHGPYHQRRFNHWSPRQQDARPWYRQPSPLGSHSSDQESSTAPSMARAPSEEGAQERPARVPGASPSKTGASDENVNAGKRGRHERLKAASKLRGAKARQEEQSRRIAEAVAAAERGERIGPPSTSLASTANQGTHATTSRDHEHERPYIKTASASSFDKAPSGVDSPQATTRSAQSTATEDSGSRSSLVTAASGSPSSRRSDTEGSFHTAMNSQSSLPSPPVLVAPARAHVQDLEADGRTAAGSQLVPATSATMDSWDVSFVATTASRPASDLASSVASPPGGRSSTSDADATTDADATVCNFRRHHRFKVNMESWDDVEPASGDGGGQSDAVAIRLPNGPSPRSHPSLADVDESNGAVLARASSPTPYSGSGLKIPLLSNGVAAPMVLPNGYSASTYPSKSPSQSGPAPINAIAPWLHRAHDHSKREALREGPSTAPIALSSLLPKRPDVSLGQVSSHHHRHRDQEEDVTRLERTREWSVQLETMAQTQTGAAMILAPLPLPTQRAEDMDSYIASPAMRNHPPTAVAAAGRASFLPTSISQPLSLAHQAGQPLWIKGGDAPQAPQLSDSVWHNSRAQRKLDLSNLYDRFIFYAHISQMPAFEEIHQRRSRPREQRLAKLMWCDLESFVEERRWTVLHTGDGDYVRLQRSWRTHSMLAPGCRNRRGRYPFEGYIEDQERLIAPPRQLVEMWKQEIGGATSKHFRGRSKAAAGAVVARSPGHGGALAELSPDTSRTEDTSSGSVEITTVAEPSDMSNIGHGPAFASTMSAAATATTESSQMVGPPYSLESPAERLQWLDDLQGMKSREKEGIKQFLKHSTDVWETRAVGNWLPAVAADDEEPVAWIPPYTDRSSSPFSGRAASCAPLPILNEPAKAFVDLCTDVASPITPLSELVESRRSSQTEISSEECEGASVVARWESAAQRQQGFTSKAPPRGPAKDRLSAAAAIFSRGKTSSSGARMSQRPDFRAATSSSSEAQSLMMSEQGYYGSSRRSVISRSAGSTPGPHSYRHSRDHRYQQPTHQQAQRRQTGAIPEERMQALVAAVRSYLETGMQPIDDSSLPAIDVTATAEKRNGTATPGTPVGPNRLAQHYLSSDISPLAVGVKQKLLEQQQAQQSFRSVRPAEEVIEQPSQDASPQPRSRTISLRQEQYELQVARQEQQRMGVSPPAATSAAGLALSPAESVPATIQGGETAEVDPNMLEQMRYRESLERARREGWHREQHQQREEAEAAMVWGRGAGGNGRYSQPRRDGGAALPHPPNRVRKGRYGGFEEGQLAINTRGLHNGSRAGGARAELSPTATMVVSPALASSPSQYRVVGPDSLSLSGQSLSTATSPVARRQSSHEEGGASAPPLEGEPFHDRAILTATFRREQGPSGPSSQEAAAAAASWSPAQQQQQHAAWARRPLDDPSLPLRDGFSMLTGPLTSTATQSSSGPHHQQHDTSRPSSRATTPSAASDLGQRGSSSGGQQFLGRSSAEGSAAMLAMTPISPNARIPPRPSIPAAPLRPHQLFAPPTVLRPQAGSGHHDRYVVRPSPDSPYNEGGPNSSQAWSDARRQSIEVAADNRAQMQSQQRLQWQQQRLEWQQMQSGAARIDANAIGSLGLPTGFFLPAATAPTVLLPGQRPNLSLVSPPPPSTNPMMGVGPSAAVASAQASVPPTPSSSFARPLINGPPFHQDQAQALPSLPPPGLDRRPQLLPPPMASPPLPGTLRMQPSPATAAAALTMSSSSPPPPPGLPPTSSRHALQQHHHQQQQGGSSSASNTAAGAASSSTMTSSPPRAVVAVAAAGQ